MPILTFCPCKFTCKQATYKPAVTILRDTERQKQADRDRESIWLIRDGGREGRGMRSQAHLPVHTASLMQLFRPWKRKSPLNGNTVNGIFKRHHRKRSRERDLALLTTTSNSPESTRQRQQPARAGPPSGSLHTSSTTARARAGRRLGGRGCQQAGYRVVNNLTPSKPLYAAFVGIGL